MKHLHAMILAGGSGSRLWPLSTPDFPKQFLPLPSGKSMIHETLARVGSLIPPERAWIVTGRSMAALVREHLPTVPLTNILCEPMGRSTAAAIGWAAASIARHDPEAIMASFHSDHAITNVEVLLQSLQLAYELAEQGHLVTLGITPTTPETGYGYIRFADRVGEGYSHKAFRAERFVEKPDLTTAQSYVDDGHYVWNSGMFVWKVAAILEEIQTHLPVLSERLTTIANAMGTPQEQSVVDEIWPTLASTSIDHGVLEKTSNLVVIPADLGWNDVGNWEQYGALFPSNELGIGSIGHHVGLGSQNIFVYNTTPHQVYTIGVEDLVVIVMDDKTVICHKNHVQRVKELAENAPTKANSRS